MLTRLYRRATQSKRRTQLLALSKLIELRDKTEERIVASAGKLEMALGTTGREVGICLQNRAGGGVKD